MAGGAGWINGWETCDARVWNSESGGQQPDPDVQRQFLENTGVKARAMVSRGVRSNMTVRGVLCEVVQIYSMDPTHGTLGCRWSYWEIRRIHRIGHSVGVCRQMREVVDPYSESDDAIIRLGSYPCNFHLEN